MFLFMNKAKLEKKEFLNQCCELKGCAKFSFYTIKARFNLSYQDQDVAKGAFEIVPFQNIPFQKVRKIRLPIPLDYVNHTYFKIKIQFC